MDRTSFVMVHLKDTERLMDLYAQRALEPRDGMLLWCLLSFADHTTGRIRASANGLADRMQSNPAEVRAGLARLKKQHLLRQIKSATSGERYYRVNPWMVTCGKPQAIGLAMKEFQEA
jgi:hypothetical protein